MSTLLLIDRVHVGIREWTPLPQMPHAGLKTLPYLLDQLMCCHSPLWPSPLLDSVSDSAFHYFTTQLTPPTDKECFWAYGIGKCLPRCKCSYQPKVRHHQFSGPLTR